MHQAGIIKFAYAADHRLLHNQKRGTIMAKVEIDVNQLPVGLTKKDFVNLPELKSQRSWFTWAGIVGIVTGVLGLAPLGQAAELQAQGYQVDMSMIMIFTLLSLVGLVLGIMLLVKNTKVTNTLSVVCLLIVLLAVMSGDTIGVVILAKVFAKSSALIRSLPFGTPNK